MPVAPLPEQIAEGGSPPIGRCPSACNSLGTGSGKRRRMPQSGVGGWGGLGGSWEEEGGTRRCSFACPSVARGGNSSQEAAEL